MNLFKEKLRASMALGANTISITKGSYRTEIPVAQANSTDKSAIEHSGMVTAIGEI